MGQMAGTLATRDVGLDMNDEATFDPHTGFAGKRKQRGILQPYFNVSEHTYVVLTFFITKQYKLFISLSFFMIFSLLHNFV